MKQFILYLKDIYNGNRVSFILIFLPYTFLVLPRIIQNPLWSTAGFICVFIAAVILDYFLNYLFQIKLTKIVVVFVVFPALIFFYFPILIASDFYPSLNLYIRSRTLILLIWFIFLSFYLIFKTEIIKFLNIFLFNFSIILIISTFYEIANSNSFEITAPISTKVASESASKKKSILLLILDEYHSPLKLYQYTKDQGVLNLKNFLIERHFHAIDVNNSDKTYTLESINGIFNKNINNSINLHQQLKETSFVNMLYNKYISFHNYGIFDIGDIPSNFHNLHYQRRSSFTGLFFSFTIINNLTGIDLKNIVFNEVQNTGGYYYYYNSQRLIDLDMILESNLNQNHFFYLHLLMPHGPFTITPKTLEEPTLTGYVNYYKFSNKILIKLLQNLDLDKFRIIITSDHGFRGNSNLNLHHGATFLKGFSESDIKKIKIIQDIGTLIESSF